MIKVSLRDDAVINVSGALDTTSVEEFNRQIAEVAPNFKNAIRINFAEVNYISSAGLRALLALNKRAKSEGGTISIVEMTGPVKRIFEITGFDKLF